jgi:putative nucleotidyltransferase with HDIG domain
MIHYPLPPWKLLVFWIALAAISESLAIVLPSKVGISVSFAIQLACTIAGGPFLAIIVAAASYVLCILRTQDGYTHLFNTPAYKSLFNTADLVLSAGLSSLVYLYSGGSIGEFLLIPTLLSVIFYAVINSLVLSELMSLINGNSLINTWIKLFKGVFLNIIAVGMIGVILALAYMSYGTTAVVLFFAPLLLARFSFKLYMDMRSTYIDTISAFNKFLEAKDMYTRGHASRVLKYSELIASEINLRADRMDNLKNAAILHDIGKIGIDDSILKKASGLSPSEYASIQEHVKIGSEIIDGIDFLKGISKIVVQHHERPDGKGYPSGLKGSSICLEASILSLADVYDAMISDRPYRKGLSFDVAMEEIRKNAGTQFDKELAEVFVKILEREKLEAEASAASSTESSAESATKKES